MSRLAFFFPQFKQHKWPGEKLLMSNIIEGLTQIGHEGLITHNVEDIAQADYIFLGNIARDLHPLYNSLKLMGRQWGIIPFYHDNVTMTRSMQGLNHYVTELLHGNPDYHLDQLLENPEILQHNDFVPQLRFLSNFEIIQDASIVLTTSPTEANTVKRECPKANVDHFWLSPGMATGTLDPIDDRFIKFAEMNPRDYLLYVGRIEPRKNLLSAIIAARNIETPFIIIASDNFGIHTNYYDLVVQAIQKYRKGPTIIYTHSYQPLESGAFKVVRIPDQASFDRKMLLSAFANCGLYLHPAFNELPGYVYLEAAKLGVPSIASKWCTVSDYFTTEGDYTLDDRILYPLPYHIDEIEQMIHSHFGKQYGESDHSIFKVDHKQMAAQFFGHVQTAFSSRTLQCS